MEKATDMPYRTLEGRAKVVFSFRKTIEYVK